MNYTKEKQIFPWHSCAGIFLPVLVNVALIKFSVLQQLQGKVYLRRDRQNNTDR